MQGNLKSRSLEGHFLFALREVASSYRDANYYDLAVVTTILGTNYDATIPEMKLRFFSTFYNIFSTPSKLDEINSAVSPAANLLRNTNFLLSIHPFFFQSQGSICVFIIRHMWKQRSHLIKEGNTKQNPMTFTLD